VGLVPLRRARRRRRLESAASIVARQRPSAFLLHDVGITPDGRRAWVTAGTSSELAVYDVRTATLPATLRRSRPADVSFTAGARVRDER